MDFLKVHARRLFVFSILCQFVSLSQQNTVRTIDVIGIGFPEESAYNDAREKAVKQSGIRILSAFSEIQSGSKTDVSFARQMYVVGLSNGLIAHEDTIQPARLLPGEITGNKPLYEVRLRIKVQSSAPSDPYFSVSISMNPERQQYRLGDRVSLDVTATQDCYVTVFCISADNKLYLVFPNRDRSKNHAKANVTLKLGLFEMGLPPGLKQAGEQLFAVATKKEFPFVNIKEGWEQIPQGGKYLEFLVVGFATKLAEWLGRLPDDQWTIQRALYSIGQ